MGRILQSAVAEMHREGLQLLPKGIPLQVFKKDSKMGATANLGFETLVYVYH